MPIRFGCTECNTSLKMNDKYAGRKVRCPECDAVIRVPLKEEEQDDDETFLNSRSSSSSSRSKQLGARQSRQNRMNDDDEFPEFPRSSKRKKKDSPKSPSNSGGAVPIWLVATASGLVGVLMLSGVLFVVLKMRSPGTKREIVTTEQSKSTVAGKPSNVVQAQVDGPGATFRMKFEMPLKWTSEGSIERNRFPWATMKGQGQVIKLSANKSLLGAAESMTTKGGPLEQLKTSHTLRGAKLQAENNDWADGQVNVHQGQRGTVIWSDYEYKGILGKGYGIRCTVSGALVPCTLMLECSQSARDKWRPTLLAIAESIHFVKIKANGQEVLDGMDGGLDDEMQDPNGGAGDQPNADQAEMMDENGGNDQ